jgi:hypothetical protein
VLSDNYALYASGKAPQWVPVAVRADTITAQKELASIRRRMRDAKKQTFRTTETQTEAHSEDRKPKPEALPKPGKTFTYPKGSE